MSVLLYAMLFNDLVINECFKKVLLILLLLYHCYCYYYYYYYYYYYRSIFITKIQNMHTNKNESQQQN